jgi:lipoprotein NlpD
VRLTGGRFSRAGLALLLALGAAGCAGSQAASRPRGLEAPPSPSEVAAPSSKPTAAASEVPAVPPIPLRAAHPEPELLTVRHRVAPGETAFRIARSYGVTVEDLATLIPTVGSDDDPDEPHAEPDVASAPERGGDSVAVGREDLPPRPSVQGRATDSRERAGASRPEPATKGMLDWPLRGVLYGRFGKKGREPHDGIDLAAPAGTPVKTGQEGTVLYAGEQKGYGLIVIVQHPNGIITLYAHNRDLRVKTGQTVRRSQVIATVGESGRTSGPHLHFEVRVDGKPVDPVDYLGPLPPS